MFRFSHFYGIKVIIPYFPIRRKITIRDTNKWLYSSNFSNVTDRKKFLPLYSFTLSAPGEGREHCAPPCQFFDRCIQLIVLWNSFHMIFPLIYIEHVTRKFFLISQIICPHRLVCCWTFTIVVYHGIVDSLLHHFSLGNQM